MSCGMWDDCVGELCGLWGGHMLVVGELWDVLVS